MSSVRVYLHNEFDLTFEEIWPDGVPENATVDDAIQHIRDQTVYTLINDWKFDSGLRIFVNGEKTHDRW